MTAKQKLEIRLSEQRSRLNELAVLEAPSEEQIAEMRELQTQHGTTEEQYRAAVAAEPPAETRTAGQSEDSETRELRSLIGKASLRSYIEGALSGKKYGGAEEELRGAFGINTDNTIPWAAIQPFGSEKRADAATAGPSDVGVSQSEILERVFAKSATMMLGVSTPMVPIGERNYPVITAGTSASMVAVDTSKDATAATITPITVEPTALSARYVFRREDTVRLRGIESALRMDLAGTMAEVLDAQNLAGDGTAPNLGGFLATASNGGLPAVTAPSAVATYNDVLKALASGVDGKYAGSEMDCSMVIGVKAYELFASLVNTGSGMTGTQYLRAQSAGVMASANIPAPSSDVEDGILARRGMVNAVCPIWEGVTLLRDETSLAATRHIAVTAIAMVGFAILRKDGFERLRFKVA